MASVAISRRDLLQRGGGVLVAFALGGALPRPGAAQTGAATDLGKPLDPHQVDSFLAFHPDGSLTIYTSKVDVGTGLRIAVRQMAAEELGIPVERIAFVEGDTALTPDQGGTGGSTGIPRGGVEIRQAAATARLAILNLASDRLQRPAAELTLADGSVRPVAGGSGVDFGALLGGQRLLLAIDPKAPLQDPVRYNVVGQPLLRPDVPGKCTGKHVYLQDFSLPGMLHARIIRPPSFGARLLSVDEASIRAIPGVRVVRLENFLAVVASDEWASIRAARELKASWSEWRGLSGSENLPEQLRAGAVAREETLVNRGDTPTALSGAAKQFSASYYWPFQSHGSLGPSCSIADVRSDSATVWSSSQGAHGLRNTLAKTFGIPQDKLRVVYMDGAGSYGTNGADDVAADALLLSKTLGMPVRVQWMRADEHGWDPKGPPQLLDVRAGLDSEGRIAAWETHMWLPVALPGTRPLLAADAAGISQPHGQNAGLLSQNADPPYTAPNVRVVTHWLKESQLRLSNLRAPGKIANAFAVESFTDELAAAAEVDALEFRLRGLSDPRALAVLRRAAEMIGWQARPSPNPRAEQGNRLTGRGLAYVRYKQSENYVATAMEVEVDRSNGAVHVRRVACAHDCGLVINPNSLRNQIEGNILQTLSRALHEEVKFDHSRVTTTDWAGYPILRFPEAPAVEVALLDHPELPPYGAGEAAAAPVAAALGNALFDATGVRFRSVPLTPTRIQAGLARA